jgi:hypothetical protein
MIKLNTSYSKKVPVEGQQFSSESFHCSMEVELSDGLTSDQIQAKIHSDAELLRQAVDAELGQAQQPAQERPKRRTFNDRPAAGQQRKASNAQIKYLTDLSGELKVTLQDLNSEIFERYGVQGLYDLSAAQASEMIDSMNGGRNRRRAA